ncbi:MAG: response regulator transcription factor [Pseudomonadota bacterium]
MLVGSDEMTETRIVRYSATRNEDGAPTPQAAARMAALAAQNFEVSDLEDPGEGPSAVRVIEQGTDTADDFDARITDAVAAGEAVLAIFKLGHGVAFRDRRAALTALGAQDVMGEDSALEELVTRVRAIFLRDRPARILVLEDDPKIADWVAGEISTMGMEAIKVTTLAEGRARFSSGPIDLLIVDRQLPDGEGLSFVRDLRDRAIHTPVLIYSALTDISDRIKGLEDAGANDYLCKPAHADELCVRVRVLLRPRESEDMLIFGPLQILRRDKVIRWRGERVEIRPRETDMLIYLAERAGLPIPQQMLYLDVWEKIYMEPGSNPVSAVKHRMTTALSKHIKAKGEDMPPFLTTEGSAYCFAPEPLLQLGEG